MENREYELTLNPREFIKWHAEQSGIFQKGKLAELPEIKQDDIRKYLFEVLACKMSNPAFSEFQWDTYKESDYHRLDLIGLKCQVISYKLDYQIHFYPEVIAQTINELIAADNIDPTFRDLPAQKMDDYADLFADEPDPKVARDLTNLQNEAYRELANVVKLSVSITVDNLIGTDYNDKVIDVDAVKALLEKERPQDISEKTGIPKTTVLKYQLDDDLNHRNWISENALKLGKYATVREYQEYYGI